MCMESATRHAGRDPGVLIPPVLFVLPALASHFLFVRSQQVTSHVCAPQADFIFCNDVFEHIPEVLNFSKSVFECLEEDGVFCIATTNSTDSIRFGDISMIEHQHVNMFTEISIHQILTSAGFSNIEISKGAIFSHKAPPYLKRPPLPPSGRKVSWVVGHIKSAYSSTIPVVITKGFYYTHIPVVDVLLV